MSKASTLKQIAVNTVSNWGAVGIQAAIGLYMVPFMIGELGKDGYGVIGIIAAIVGFSEIADLGLRTALNRELSEKTASQDREGFRKLSTSALALYLFVATAFSVVLYFSGPIACSFFSIGVENRSTVLLLLQTYAPFCVVLGFVVPVLTAGLVSFMRYDIVSNVGTVSQICNSLGLLVFLSFSQANPLFVWCLVMGAGQLIRAGILYGYYRRICFGGILARRYLEVRSLLPLLQLGMSMYFVQLSVVLSQRTDPLVISRFLGPAAVGLYQAGSSLPRMIYPLVFAGVNQILPLTTKYHLQNNVEREQQVLILGTKFTLYLGSFFCAGMLLFADPFCHAWLYDKLGDDVVTVALVLKLWAGANFFSFAGGSQGSVLLGKRKINFIVFCNLPLALINVALSIYFVGFLGIGLAGVLVATVICEFLKRFISIWYLGHYLKVGVYNYLRRAYFAPVALFLLLLAIMSWLLPVVESSWSGLVLAGAVLTLLTAALMFCFEFRLIRKLKSFKHELGY
jgi:O-antigen/teichoic acid export membrane protein